MNTMNHRRQSAFTLVEMMITVGVVGALATIAIPSYQGYVEQSKRTRAITDIATISLYLERYYTVNFSYPPSLAALGGDQPNDPWGNPYRYLAIDIVPPPNLGAMRKDKNMVPLNSDYDLYSMGPDGLSRPPLTAAHSRDDIVRAANGGFIGPASEH